MSFKKFWIRFSVLSVVLAGASYIVYSCADYDACDSYVSFFSPNTVSVKNYTPFYYVADYQFYNCDEDTSNNFSHADDDKNIDEWKAYTQQPINKKDISTLLYKTSFSELSSIYYYLEKEKPLQISDSTKQNEFVKWFMNEKDLDALGYLMYAKQCEPIATAAKVDWEPPVINVNECNRLIRNGLQLFHAIKKDEIKRRYVFQVVRLAFYEKQFDRVVYLHDSLIKLIPAASSSLNDRMLSYKAGALYRLNQKAESAYLFSKLFDKTDDYARRFNEYISYDWTESEKKMNEVLSYCKTNHEKSVVYALHAFKHPNLTFNTDHIQQVYDFDAKNEMLDVLLLREINRIESLYSQFRYRVDEGFAYYEGNFGWMNLGLSKKNIEEWMKERNAMNVNIQKVSDFILRISNENKLTNKSLWITSAAYLKFLKEEYSQVDSLTEIALENSPSDKVKNELKIIHLLNSISKQEKMTGTYEQTFFSELQWLEAKSNQSEMYRKVYYNLLRTILPLKYMQSKDTTKAMLCFAKYEQLSEPPFDEQSQPITSFYQKYWQSSGDMMDKLFTVTQLVQLKDFYKSDLTTFEKWLTKGNVYTNDMINELIAVKYLRENQYQQASNVLSGSKNMPSIINPFVAHVRDYQDGYYEDTLKQYTLKQLADTLSALERSSETNTTSAYRLACALYSMSYHGKCGNAVSYYRSYYIGEPYMYDVKKKYSNFIMQYYYADKALKLFKQVYANSKEISQKQSALWMIAKIYQKRFPDKPAEDYWVDKSDGKGDAYSNWATFKNPYLKEFHEKYKGTKYYEDVFNECSYLRNFVRK